MALTPKPLADGQLPNTKQTLYTVPASTRTIVKTIILVNTDSVARTINLYVKPGSTSRRIYPKDYSMAASAQTMLEVDLMLDTGDVLEGDASVAGVVDYFICGVEGS